MGVLLPGLLCGRFDLQAPALFFCVFGITLAIRDDGELSPKLSLSLKQWSTPGTSHGYPDHAMSSGWKTNTHKFGRHLAEGILCVLGPG